MTDVVVTNPSEMRELTIDELDEAGGGFYPPARAWWAPAFSTFSASSSTNSHPGY
jgi:hypothetical protein